MKTSLLTNNRTITPIQMRNFISTLVILAVVTTSCTIPLSMPQVGSQTIGSKYVGTAELRTSDTKDALHYVEYDTIAFESELLKDVVLKVTYYVTQDTIVHSALVKAKTNQNRGVLIGILQGKGFIDDTPFTEEVNTKWYQTWKAYGKQNSMYFNCSVSQSRNSRTWDIEEATILCTITQNDYEF